MAVQATKVTEHLQSTPAIAGSVFAKTRRKLRTGWRVLRENPSRVIGLLVKIERFVVYHIDPRNVRPPDSVQGVTLVKLSDQDLANLPNHLPELQEHRDRFRRDGFNDAYALYQEGKLAHLSWLITAEHDCLIPVRNVKLRANEAEITHCLTLPDFRGRGLYAHAIRSLCQMAAARGVRRLFMITNVRNKASQRGMEKAGLSRCGRIFRFVSPHWENLYFTCRMHRWR